MTTQFKKFLLALASLGLGMLTLKLLVLVYNSNGVETFFPAAEFIDMAVSVVGVFIYYHFLKKMFLSN